MNKKELTPGLSVGPQIQPDDMQTLADSGFRSIICNRPDGESPGQPAFEQINSAAKALNIVARHIPVEPGNISTQDVDNFNSALLELPGPTFAYCRTGFRSQKLWSLTQPATNPLSSLIKTVKEAGAGVLRARR